MKLKTWNGVCNHLFLQQPTLSDMTQFELNFSYKLEEMMSTIVHPEYRQLIVEVWYSNLKNVNYRYLLQLLCIVATVLERNPEVAFHDKFDCEEVSFMLNLRGDGTTVSHNSIDFNFIHIYVDICKDVIRLVNMIFEWDGKCEWISGYWSWFSPLSFHFIFLVILN